MKPFLLLITFISLTIVSLNANPTIIQHPVDASICLGRDTSFSLSSLNAGSFQWQIFDTAWTNINNGPIFSGATDSILVLTNPSLSLNFSQYRCIVMGSGGLSDTSNTAWLSFTLTQANSSASIGLGYCLGDSLTLFGSGADSFVWDNGVVDGVPFAASSTTLYSVTGTDATGCVSTDTIRILVYPLPNIGINANTPVCSGDLLTLQGSGGSSYAWNNNVIDNDPFLVFNAATYIVTATNANGCQDTLSIFINPLATPVVNLSPNDTTICVGQTVLLNATAGASYQWYSDGNPISGANSSSYSVTTTGTYNMVLTDVNGCSDSASIGTMVTVAVCTGLNKPTALSSISIYPNPSEGLIAIEGDWDGLVHLQLFNTQGQFVRKKHHLTSSIINWDLNDLPKGLYFLSVQDSKTTVTTALFLR